MKTSQNVAKVSAQMIRAAVKDIVDATAGGLVLNRANAERYDNALKVISATATSLDEYSRGFNDSQADGATDPAI